MSTAALLPFARVTDIAFVLAGDFGNALTALGLGIISTFSPFVFYTSGLKRIEAGKASVLAFAEPMIATIAGIVVFNEPLYLKNAAGILMIFAAIVLLNIPLAKAAKKIKHS